MLEIQQIVQNKKVSEEITLIFTLFSGSGVIILSSITP